MIRNELPNGNLSADASAIRRDVVQASHLPTLGDAATAARAAANIAEWQSYLPEDCVKAMIRDGWHVTT
jgi:hypothetical protein